MNRPYPVTALRPRTLLSLLLTCLGLWATGAGRASDSQAADGRGAPAGVSIFLVRHAEKASDDPRDSNLSELGRRRAAELDRMLSDAGVTHLYSTDYRRTRQTLAPLAQRTQLEVRAYDPRQPAGLVEELRRLPAGSVALVAGHSNTVPALYAELSGAPASGLVESPHGPLIEDSTYDRLFLVTLARDEGGEPFATSALELRYGESGS